MALSISNLVRKDKPKPPIMVVYGPGGMGKAQPVDCEVQTPNGPRPIGDLTPGDVIFGFDGKPQSVLAVYPQGICETYRITFKDGASTRCNLDHLWRVNTRKTKNVIKTTREIIEYMEDRSDSAILRIPNNPLVEFDGKGGDIDPYLLGFYIADGCGTGSVVQLTVCAADADIIPRVERAIPEGYSLAKRDAPGCIQCNIVCDEKAKGDGFINKIAALGLAVRSGEKFIPVEYLNANQGVREDILAGLMDGDGSTKNGRTFFHTSSERLANDVKRLVQSLGGKAKVMKLARRNGKGQEFSLNVRTDFNPFLCARKKSAWKKVINNKMHRNIISIEQVEDAEHVCIRVSNSDSLYLTDDFIVTHNTTLAAEFPAPIFIQTEVGEGDNKIISFTDGAIRSFNDVMEAITSLATEDHEFQTVVIDSITRLEPLIWKQLCADQKWTSIEDPGYGKGYILADPYWRDFLDALSYLRDEKGMTVIMIAHETVTTFKDPMTDSYDRYTMRLHKRAEAFVREVCDALGFMNQVTMIRKETKAFGKKDDYVAKGSGSGTRAINFQPRPAFDAKGRGNLPDQIIVQPGQGYASLAPYLPGHSAASAAKSAA